MRSVNTHLCAELSKLNIQCSRYYDPSVGALLEEDNGASLGQYSYKPYGKLLSSSTPVSGNPFTYTAREDDGTALYYYRARYYDPTLELFISQDPLGDAQRYVGGNPISFVDPLGLYDVAFFGNKQIGPFVQLHPAIVSEPDAFGERHLYYKTLSDTPGKGIPYIGKLKDYYLANRDQIPGGVYIYELDPNIFKDEDIFETTSNIYGLSNCSTYVGDVLNNSINKRNRLSPQNDRLPQVNGLSPVGLYNSLMHHKYISPKSGFMYKY